jgi:hypothetical protein
MKHDLEKYATIGDGMVWFAVIVLVALLVCSAVHYHGVYKYQGKMERDIRSGRLDMRH